MCAAAAICLVAGSSAAANWSPSAGTAAVAGPARAACLVPGVGKPLDQAWHPGMLAAIGYNDHRTGDIAFAVRTDHRFYGYRPNHVEWSASVVKAMLMVVYLDRPSVARRDLSSYDRSLLGPMITESDNEAAQQVFDTVGQGGLCMACPPRRDEALRNLADLGRDPDHGGRPDQVLPALRALCRHAPSRLRDATARQHRALRALGDRPGRCPRAGGSTSRAAGATARACSTTRSRFSSAAAPESPSPSSPCTMAPMPTARRRSKASSGACCAICRPVGIACGATTRVPEARRLAESPSAGRAGWAGLWHSRASSAEA